ncbi:hypothetical protein ABG943_01075 [Bifidobacterium catenulatum]
MTDLKMFSKPVVFTDFDGVLNAFPDDKLLRRGGVNKVMTWAKPDSPYAKMYNPEKAFHLDGNEKAHTPVGSWRIHWSSELSDAMYALAVDGIVELWWLSTWQPYCSQILDPMLGWDPMLVDVITWYDPVTKWGRETGKWQTIQRRVRIECEENEPAPIVWIDDDECFEQRAALGGTPAESAGAYGPSGLSYRHQPSPMETDRYVRAPSRTVRHGHVRHGTNLQDIRHPPRFLA